MTNLYNRTLLSTFEVSEFEELLDSAKEFVQDGLSGEVKISLLCRLDFRKALLRAVSVDVDVIASKDNHHWAECLEFLSSVIKSNPLGVPVSRCFTTKVQRRLASTVPPRPIVSIDFVAAYDFLKRLCEDGAYAPKVLDCLGGSNILVCWGHIMCSTKWLTDHRDSFQYSRPANHSLAFT